MNTPESPDSGAREASTLERGTYEVLQQRMAKSAQDLRKRLDRLNEDRRGFFGAIEVELERTVRVTTDHNCVPQDLFCLGDRVLLGYQVSFGLKAETKVDDVFAVYRREKEAFRSASRDWLADPRFESDFAEIFRYYKRARFVRFATRGPIVYMVFRLSEIVTDIKVLKWAIDGDSLRYVDNRSEREFQYPPQHDFDWARAHRDHQRPGLHPHISIDDRLFVETVGGDLTIKVEDNTDTGEGIYSEPVDNKDQTLDDAEVFFATIGSLIFLKIRPYQEDDYRYFVYNEKLKEARRIDTIASSCVLLPDSQGIIFSNGYYLQSGDLKLFDSDLRDMMFETRIAAPNGEDYLYVFFNRLDRIYVLLSYNMIEQSVGIPIVCHGFSLFQSGELVLFRGTEEAQRHHQVQIWITPYQGQDSSPPEGTGSLLEKIGNRDLVRGMSECRELTRLIDRDEKYEGLYIDLAKRAGDVLDSYFWIDEEEAHTLSGPVTDIQGAAQAAIEEYEKVVALQRSAAESLSAVEAHGQQLKIEILKRRFESVNDFVASLGELRGFRGKAISLRETRYMSLAAVDKLELWGSEQSEALAQRCVEFLLKPEALLPYQERITAIAGSVDAVQTVVDARATETEIDQHGEDLELLIETVSNLEIDNANDRTAIIDSISEIFARVNQTRAALKKRERELRTVEGAAEFSSQLRLLEQSTVNFLDLAESPEKCDELLSRQMVQVEELEAKFAEFDDYVERLAEKRQAIYDAFESRRVQLVEARSQRAATLQRTAERLLGGIENRLRALDSVDEINAYYAGDVMVDKVRKVVANLLELGDTVKADELQTRVKAIKESSLRELKDRLELYVDGENVVRFGDKNFTVNTQVLDLTVVPRDGEMYFHLTGTGYFQPIEDSEFRAHQDLWSQSLVSESDAIYRAEYLAFLFAESLPTARRRESQSLEDRVAQIREFMSPRYAEGYVKGVHDYDAALIVERWLTIERELGSLRYSPAVRAIAEWIWTHQVDPGAKSAVSQKLRAIGVSRAHFTTLDSQEQSTSRPELSDSIHSVSTDGEDERAELEQLIKDPIASLVGVGRAESITQEAAEFLAEVLSESGLFPDSPEAIRLRDQFVERLDQEEATAEFWSSVGDESDLPAARYFAARQWIHRYQAHTPASEDPEYVWEAARLLLDPRERQEGDLTPASHPSSDGIIRDLRGSHPRLDPSGYELNVPRFVRRLRRYAQEHVPRFQAFVQLKKHLIDAERERLRLDEFKPKVLSSFVRNQLIDRSYLPLIGDNLAKQIGTAGADTRTDRMGLLLLVSPPGYGKTTLMEYVADRLGLTFVKINGPAIGHQVTSLDPSEAAHASARQEIERLNLALEMGDNVMIYLDDIQHTHPELLQKFISLCDGQRKIEGVFRGRSRTYDLRGKKVAVIMAGNPYTESGEKFQIPDMLANRADTYNLGEVIGDNESVFELSYLENSMTSNPLLSEVATRHPEDIVRLIQLATSSGRESIDLAGDYSPQQLTDYLRVLEHLFRVRDVILTVNREYVGSAAQADDYRTEPPFKLQGSYRNMNKLAARVLAVQTDAEIEELIWSHYDSESQTLTTGAEANLLKLGLLLERLTEDEKARWGSIRETFVQNNRLRGLGSDDASAQMLLELQGFAKALHGIREVIASHPGKDVEGRGELSILGPVLESIRDTLSQAPEVNVVTKIPLSFLNVIRRQFQVLERWMIPIVEILERSPDVDLSTVVEELAETRASYDDLVQRLEDGERDDADSPDDSDGKSVTD